MNRQSARPLTTDIRRGISATLALTALGLAAAASAVDFQGANGVNGSWDTTISFGEGWRVKAPEANLIGIPEAGAARSVNADNGDLNYKVGQPFSQALKVVTEVSLKSEHYGLFVRGSLLYDRRVEDARTVRTPISSDAKALAGYYVRLLDAFVFGKWQLADTHPLEIRLGNQVLNWGESTFIQGGLVGVNAIDVQALRIPGSELKEAFWAQPMARLTLGLTQNVSAEAFVVPYWRRTEPEPVGTYFSTNDTVPRGGTQNFIGFGAYSDQGTDFRPLGGPVISNFWVSPRAPDVEPKKSGQYGLALRFFLPSLGSGTEIAVYGMQYASRLPVVSTRTGTPAGLGNALATAATVQAGVQALVAGATPAAAVRFGTGYGLQTAAKAGGDISAQTLATYATIGVNTYLSGGNVLNQALQLANHEYIETTQYFAEYPDNLQTFAVSFNTQLGTTGIALQGEFDWRRNTPLQFDDSELVFATGSPLEPVLFAAQGLPFPADCNATVPTLTRCNQLGVFAPGQYVQGWGRYNVYQFQMTATKAFPPMLGAQQGVLVAEVGLTSIPGLPSKTGAGPAGQGLRFESPGTNLSGNMLGAATQFGGGSVEPLNRFADRTSWGYVLLAKLDYPSLIGAWNLSPRITWEHDVRGTTPGPGGNFIEGRHSLGIGLNASLQNRWAVDVSYANFGGAGQYNLLRDRDFIAASLKYSF